MPLTEFLYSKIILDIIHLCPEGALQVVDQDGLFGGHRVKDIFPPFAMLLGMNKIVQALSKAIHEAIAHQGAADVFTRGFFEAKLFTVF
jgi:hypothetical protein